MEAAQGGKPISEIEGKDADIMMADARVVNKKASKRRDPNITSIELDNTSGAVTIESVNIKQVQIKYYLINAEILFSRAPFLKDNAESFSYVKPFHTVAQQMVPEAADEATMNSTVRKVIQVPAELTNQNMVIEILGQGKQEFKTFYSNQIKVTTLETFGELKVTHNTTGKPLPSVYIKVFAQHKNGGADFFFRDGYTDICGKLEYA